MVTARHYGNELGTEKAYPTLPCRKKGVHLKRMKNTSVLGQDGDRLEKMFILSIEHRYHLFCFYPQINELHLTVELPVLVFWIAQHMYQTHDLCLLLICLLWVRIPDLPFVCTFIICYVSCFVFAKHMLLITDYIHLSRVSE